MATPQTSTLQWIIGDSVARCMPARHDVKDLCSALHRGGIYNIVDIGNYDCSFAWRFGDHARRWQIAATSPHDQWLHYLREFCLYELLHGRKVAILTQQEQPGRSVDEGLLDFLGPAPRRQQLEQLMIQQQLRILEALDSGLDGSRPENDPTCRYSPSNLACHATDAAAALKIVRNGEILSACGARRSSGDRLSLEPRNAAGDPPDYFDFVMFGPAVHPGLDKLVNERLLGRAPSWHEMESGFTPAIRFFFRRRDILRHSRFCCDGLHEKVRHAMELRPCLVAALVPQDTEGSAAVANQLQRCLPKVPLVQLARGNDGPERWAGRVARELISLEGSSGNS